MYSVTNEYKSAIESTSRVMCCKAYLNGVEISTDKILKLDIEDNINNGDYFTIGEVPSKTLIIEIVGIKGVVEGVEIKPYIGVEVNPNVFEFIPCGVFYADSISSNKDRLTITCYDKMVSLDEEYIPSVSIPVSLVGVMNDICRQKVIEFEGVLPDITINKSIKGYSYREMVGFIASFCGGNAKFNRFGKLIIQQYSKSTKVINSDVCAKFEEKEVYEVSAIACKFGNVANTRGDDRANCVNFINPYVDDTNIDSIFTRLNGLTFTSAKFKYKGDPSVDSGDLITIIDVKNNNHTVLVSTQDFKFSGGLSSEVTSIGEGKCANGYKQYKFKNKKSVTELNVELGLIQAIVSEVEEKQEDTYTKTETNTIIEAKAGEISLEVSKKEVSNIKTGGTNLVRNGNFESGGDFWVVGEYLGQPHDHAIWENNDWNLNGKKMMCIRTYDLPDEPIRSSLAVRTDFKTVPGKEYTISYYIAGHRSEKWCYVHKNVNEEMLCVKKYGHILGGNNEKDWVWDSMTFTAKTDLSTFFAELTLTTGTNAYLWLTDVCCVEGNVASKWVSSDMELRESIAKIDVKSDYINLSVTSIEKNIRDNIPTNTTMQSAIDIKAGSITSTVGEKIEVSKQEAINVAAGATDAKLGRYSTTVDMNSAIMQSKNQIKQEVSETYATIENVNNNFTTKSELNQTKESFDFELTQSGGYNVVMNGNALKGKDFWNIYYMPSAVWNIRNDMWSGYVPCFEIQNPSGARDENVLHQDVPTVIGKTYTFSAMVAGHRARNYLSVVNGGGTYVIANSQHAIQVSGGEDANKWMICTVTFVAPESTTQLRLISYPDDPSFKDTYGWFKEIQLEEGSYRTHYTPHPSEIYSGVTSIDKDGVKVTHSIDASYSHMGAKGFIYNASGSNHRYHNLMQQGWILPQFGGNWSTRIDLRAEFRGKPFSIIISLDHLEATNLADAFKHVQVTVPHDQVDYANGTCNLYVNASALWAEGLSINGNVKVGLSWVAIA